MNPFPSPLLCLYCDKIILPGNKEGCRKHMLECKHHPALAMLSRYKDLATELRIYFDSGCLDETTDLFLILQDVEKF